MKIEEGFIPFKGYQTYYRTVGENTGDKKPIVFLHGGPGSSHNYFELLDELAEDGRMLVMYDQLGCGNSSTPSRPDLWNMATWTEELILLRKYLKLDEAHILGQSWGGMLLISYLIENQPEGVKSAILSSTLPSSSLWEQEQKRWISLMSDEEQNLLLSVAEKGNYDDPAYQKAEDHYMLLHSSDSITDSSPEPLRRKKASGKESYMVAWGPNEFSPQGNLKHFEYTERLNEIAVPSLIMSGANDLSSPVIGKTMYDGIPHAKWELFANSRHMPFVDEKEKYLAVLKKWLNDND